MNGASSEWATAAAAAGISSGSGPGYSNGSGSGISTVSAWWIASATASSPAGSYAIEGSGLSAVNYSFVQDPANASALTLAPAAVNDTPTNATQTTVSYALRSVTLPVAACSA